MLTLLTELTVRLLSAWWSPAGWLLVVVAVVRPLLAWWPLGWWPLVVVVAVGLLVVLIGGEWELGVSAAGRGLSALPPVVAAVLALLAAKPWLRMLLTRSRETRGSDAWSVAV